VVEGWIASCVEDEELGLRRQHFHQAGIKILTSAKVAKLE